MGVVFFCKNYCKTDYAQLICFFWVKTVTKYDKKHLSLKSMSVLLFVCKEECVI